MDPKKRLKPPQAPPPPPKEENISPGASVSTEEEVNIPYSNDLAVKSEPPVIKEEYKGGMTDAESTIYKDLMNLDMSENILAQDTIRSQVFLSNASDDLSSVNKGDPSLRDILHRQVDLAEKQENLLKSCREAMDQQKSMFERMGDILKQVSLTQEKTSTSKQPLFLCYNLIILYSEST